MYYFYFFCLNVVIALIIDFFTYLLPLTLYLFKYVDLRKNPSLEFAMILVFTYAPYGLAEGLHLSGSFFCLPFKISYFTTIKSKWHCHFDLTYSLSGIMSILFNGVVMSHYTHFNLSPVTQITMQQTLRTLAFFAGKKWYVCMHVFQYIVPFLFLFIVFRRFFIVFYDFADNVNLLCL